MKTNDKTAAPALRPISLAAALAAAAAGFVFFNKAWLTASLACLALAADCVLTVKIGKRLLSLIPDGLAAGCLIAAAASGSFFPTLIFTGAAFVIIAGSMIYATARAGASKKKKAVSLTAEILLVLILGVPALIDLCPDPLFEYGMQGGVMERTAVFSDSVRADGVREIRDLTYPSAYPNNTMDIFLTPQNKGTILYIHGGGFVIGDKDDPEQNQYLNAWIKNGYNVAAIDYALAPQYDIDTQIVQCGKAIDHLLTIADGYGIDTKKIVPAGDSAGGCLSGVLVAAATDPVYARELGLDPLLGERFRPAAWISIAGAVDLPRAGRTNNDIKSWGFNLMVVSGLSDHDYARSDKGRLCSVLGHVNGNFPPCFISDGNDGTFTDQAEDLYAALLDLGVKAEINLVPPSKAKLSHVYELLVEENALAAENFEKTLGFIESVL